MSANVTYTEFDKLKSELEKDRPDFEKVRQIISASKHLLNEPIGKDGEYVLHFACWKNAPSNIVIEFINDNPLALQQKDNYGDYPLHLACQGKQPESVIQLLVNKYPLAVQQKRDNGFYPLHSALMFKQSESVIQLLIKEYPLAVQQKSNNGYYPLHWAIISRQNENVVLKLIELFPEATAEIEKATARVSYFHPLHLACRYNQSEKVLLVLIHLSLDRVKHKDCNDVTPLSLAKEYNQSSTIIKVLEELTTMSDYDLKNRIGIPTIVTLHGLENLHRNDIFQWVLDNSPILIDGEYMIDGKNIYKYRLSKKRKAISVTRYMC